MAAVALTDVVKLYGRQLAVRGIDLEIPDRSFTVFVGPSGCGKSTTLRMIAGLESISHGTLTMDGERVNDTPSRDRGVAMVFQSYALYPHMSVRRNLEFSLKLEKLPKAEIAARVNEAAAVLELTPYLDRKPQALSGGQRQRVAMGRAIVREPSVFLFDEPLSNLDAKLRNQMRVEIKRLQQRLNVTTIYVTHDQVEAMTLADNMVVMRDGLIEQTGTPLEIFERPVNRFVAGFIGSPQMNFLEGRVVVHEGRPRLDAAGLSLPIDTECFSRDWRHGDALVAGLRPEAIVPTGHGLEPARSLKIESEVEFTEMLGNETLIFARFGDTDIVSRMAQPRPLAAGERVEMHVDLDRVHLFDGVSGASIRTLDAPTHEERH